MSTIELALSILGSSALAAIITTLANRRAIKSQAKSNEAHASDLLSRTYSLLIKDLNAQIENLKSINKELAEHKDKLIKDINELHREVDNLRKQVVKLTDRLKKYEG